MAQVVHWDNDRSPLHYIRTHGTLSSKGKRDTAGNLTLKSFLGQSAVRHITLSPGQLWRWRKLQLKVVSRQDDVFILARGDCLWFLRSQKSKEILPSFFPMMHWERIGRLYKMKMFELWGHKNISPALPGLQLFLVQPGKKKLWFHPGRLLVFWIIAVIAYLEPRCCGITSVSSSQAQMIKLLTIRNN